MNEPIIHAGRIEHAPENDESIDEYVDAYRIHLPIAMVGKRYMVFGRPDAKIAMIPYTPMRVYVRTPAGYVYYGTHRAVYPEPRYAGGAVITIRDPLAPAGTYLIPADRDVDTIITYHDDAGVGCDDLGSDGWVVEKRG